MAAGPRAACPNNVIARHLFRQVGDALVVAEWIQIVLVPPRAARSIHAAERRIFAEVDFDRADPQLQQAGQLQLATFVNPEGLLKQGENLYLDTDASGPAQQVNPGQTGAGLLRQGALEMSNVEPVRELIDLITTQRSFELNSQAVQAGDQILQLIANLRRF